MPEELLSKPCGRWWYIPEFVLSPIMGKHHCFKNTPYNKMQSIDESQNESEI